MHGVGDFADWLSTPVRAGGEGLLLAELAEFFGGVGHVLLHSDVECNI